MKLIAFLQDKLGPNYSAKRIKKAIEHNACLLNGSKERFASTLLGKGDRIQMDISLLQEKTQVRPLFEPSRVLYEDKDLLVYNKPAGIASDEMGISQVVHQYIPHAELVHRLDKDTTGALLFAKSKPILNAMIQSFQKQTINKVYLAIVDGIPKSTSGNIENYLGKLHDYEGQTIWGEVPKNKGVLAKTDWRLEGTAEGASLLMCYPKTGRTHQIRVHLFEMGHPILGDYQYAREFKSNYRPLRYLLHAWQLSFMHPATEALIEVTAPIPHDFPEAWKSLSGKHNRWLVA